VALGTPTVEDTPRRRAAHLLRICDRMTSPTLTLGQLAEQLAGELRPASAASFLVKGVTGLRSATADRLVFAEDARAFAEAIVSGAAAVLTGARIAEATDQVAEAGNCPLLEACICPGSGPAAKSGAAYGRSPPGVHRGLRPARCGDLDRPVCRDRRCRHAGCGYAG
jgi:hypothetical protein